MFYNHEILTSRKYGIATIWLVATLGSRNHLKKIGRKTILEVNVTKACETITTPEAPMALRLQSSLLYGVTRVFSQQCEYVLVDAQGMQSAMRQMLTIVHHAELDMETGRGAKPEQLLLQDDPGFLPDLAFEPLDLDFSNLDLATDGSSQGDSILSPHTHPSSRTSLASLPGIVIPSTGSVGGDVYGGFEFRPDEDTEMTGVGQAGFEDFGVGELLPDAGFTFDAQGNMYDTDLSHGEGAALPPGSDPPVARSDTSILNQVRRDHEEARLAGEAAAAAIGDVDMEGLPPFGDQDVGEVMPSSEHQQQTQLEAISATQHPHHGQSTEIRSDETSQESRSAPLVRRSRRKPLDKDIVTELRNSDLISWNQNYLANMEEAKKHKTALKETTQAKHNARDWLWGNGLGAIGSGIASFGIATPFDAFHGDGLYNLLIGTPDRSATKRDGERSLADGADSDDRRVRPRSGSAQETGRGAEAAFARDDDGFGAIGDDMELEVGRQAPTPLPGDLSHDASSVMPWNISAHSRSRVGSLSSRQQAHQPQRRGSRLVSASPLLGRGSAVLPPSRAGSVGSGIRPISLPAGGISSSGNDAGFDDGFILPPLGSDEDRAVAAPTFDSDFERYGPAAAVDTQTAAASQWVRERLDIESNNFLEFVETAVAERQSKAAEHGDSEPGPHVTFEELLPPASNSRIVAAQGLLHVLVLATRDVLTVEQERPFEAITLGVKALTTG